MSRPSLRTQRRGELTGAFERVFGTYGFEGATITQIAAEAGVSPGLLHHYFDNKDEMVVALLARLDEKFQSRVSSATCLGEMLSAALAVDARADPIAARAWVGIFAEAVRKRGLRSRLRRVMTRYTKTLERVCGDEQLSLGALALIIGFLVLGAIDPQLTRGRASSIAARLVAL